MKHVDFAIITIRTDEFEAVLQRFPTHREQGISGRTYGISDVSTKTGDTCRVAVVRSSDQGNEAAQQLASDIIHDLDPQLLLVVGIAGGVPGDDFTLGDVIISTRIDNLNASKRLEDGSEVFDIRGGIHPKVSDITANLQLYQQELAGWNDASAITLPRPTVNLAQFETNDFLAKIAPGQKNASWYRKVRSSIISHSGNAANQNRPPLFQTGTIASSNSLIRNIDLLLQWLQTAHAILAFEMESAGVFQAAQGILHQYPIMAIRGISDIIGLERDNQWTKYACQTAASFTHAFVSSGIITPREQTPPSSNEHRPSSSGTDASQINNNPPIEVFISYAQEDERSMEQLEKQLAPLTRNGIIRPWHSQQIQPGQEWEEEIASHINSAQIILLLVSANFLASDLLYDREIMRAMERQATGTVRVIPIILSPVDLSLTPFKKLQPLPRNMKSVVSGRNKDEVWYNIVQEIRQVCKQLRKNDGHSI